MQNALGLVVSLEALRLLRSTQPDLEATVQPTSMVQAALADSAPTINSPLLSFLSFEVGNGDASASHEET